MRQFAEQRAEFVDEGSVDVIRQQHQVGTFCLHQIRDLADGFLAHRHAGRIAGIDNEKCFDLRVLQPFQFLVRILEAVLLRRSDVQDLEIVVFQVGHFQIGREDRRAKRDGIARVQ